MKDGRVLEMFHGVMPSMVYYAASSSCMLVLNKVAVHHVPLPSCVLGVQFAMTLTYIAVFRSAGYLVADSLDYKRMKTFAPYAMSFVLSVYCNGKVLQFLNVETLIVFRSCGPIIVSVLDWMYLGRELPNKRSILALFVVLVGAVGYVMADSEFQMHGAIAYGWVVVYLACNCFEMTYGKVVLSRVKFEAPVWGSVLYTNAMAIGPMLLLAIVSGEAARLQDVTFDASSVRALLLSCSAGIAISWAGWNCRSLTSATTYTLLGVVCKFFSVILNVMIWDKHASPVGISWLIVCLVASAAYRQAPLRKQCEPPIRSDSNRSAPRGRCEELVEPGKPGKAGKAGKASTFQMDPEACLDTGCDL
eukprot:gb/GFBE01039702.1/.p1 GENE.gb/GFBE01039702.1/~~gb/GFBE01039702.1/.p1  ORF type:complete len:361 (+),score=65.44 gb/GFBE01039702.1/:1-1083(+)